MRKKCNPKPEYLKIVAAVLFSFYFIRCVQTPDTFHFIGAVNLIIHEAGHIIFTFFGEFMRILGGSLTQVLVPALFVWYFFSKKDFFSGGIIVMWMGESIIEVARYAGDAVLMQLPLLGGDSVIHDWNWLLSYTHTIAYTSAISECIYMTGVLLLAAGIFVSLASKLFVDGD